MIAKVRIAPLQQHCAWSRKQSRHYPKVWFGLPVEIDTSTMTTDPDLKCCDCEGKEWELTPESARRSKAVVLGQDIEEVEPPYQPVFVCEHMLEMD